MLLYYQCDLMSTGTAWHIQTSVCR